MSGHCVIWACTGVFCRASVAHRQSKIFAGIRCETIETERAWHARQLVAELTVQELGSYDGIVAVSPFTVPLLCLAAAFAQSVVFDQ